ncbi:histone H1-like nucleoprotein HC2, partial [Gregarina niphandrodes]
GRPRARPVASEENAAARKKNAVALVQEAVTQTAVVQKAVVQTAVAQKAVAQKAVAQKAVAQKAVAQKAVAQKAVAQKAVAQKPVAQKAVAETTGGSRSDEPSRVASVTGAGGEAPVMMADSEWQALGASSDPAVEEAQAFVSETIASFSRPCANTCAASSTPNLVSSVTMRSLEARMRPVRRVPARFSAWRWGVLAGEVYRRTDRGQMAASLASCETKLGRPAGVSDVWYLAKLLQQKLGHQSALRLAKNLGLKLEEGATSVFMLQDIVMERHFVGLPPTSDADRMVIWAVAEVVSWLLKTRAYHANYGRILRNRGRRWACVDSFAIDLCAFLHKLLGPTRFHQLAQVARKVLSSVKKKMSDACFLACFLGAVNLVAPCVSRTFCSHIGFPRNHTDGAWPVTLEGADFFGRIPVHTACPKHTPESQTVAAHSVTAPTVETVHPAVAPRNGAETPETTPVAELTAATHSALALSMILHEDLALSGSALSGSALSGSALSGSALSRHPAAFHERASPEVVACGINDSWVSLDPRKRSRVEDDEHPEAKRTP